MSTNYTYVREWSNTDHRFVVLTAAGGYLLEDATERPGVQITFKNQFNGANALTPLSPQLIDGAGTYSLATQYTHVTLMSDGHNWNIVG